MQPLSRTRILSLATNVPGPAAVARLRQMGATVIKIEPPGGDPLALVAPAWYRALHAGIQCHTLDLKTKGGLAHCHALLADTDLLLTSLRPAALARLGLDWPSLSARYPDLCQVAIIGYPPPDKNKPGHDLNYQARQGLVGPPQMPRTLLADLAGAERAATAALALLLGRALGHGPGLAQVSLAEAAAAFAAPWRAGLTQPGGLLGGGAWSYHLYPAEDGWLTLAALEPHFQQRVLAALGLERERALRPEQLAGIFQTQPVAHWEQWAREHDLPLAAVQLSPPPLEP